MLKTVALFAGCGGLDLGFENAGFEIIWANDNNNKIADTYKYNHKKTKLLIGSIVDINSDYVFPNPTHHQGNYNTLEDAIGDLRDNPGEWMEGSFSPIFMSRNRRRSWNEVGFTVQASGRQTQIHPDSSEMEKVDKDKWQFKNDSSKTVRRMSVRECARIQTFPDCFEFLSGSLNENYKMIGNAVPVKLAESIAKNLKRCIEDGTALEKEIAIAN